MAALKNILDLILLVSLNTKGRGGSRAAATSKIECFVIMVNDWKPLNIITKRSILEAAAVLNPPLKSLQMFLKETVAAEVLP